MNGSTDTTGMPHNRLDYGERRVVEDLVRAHWRLVHWEPLYTDQRVADEAGEKLGRVVSPASVAYVRLMLGFRIKKMVGDAPPLAATPPIITPESNRALAHEMMTHKPPVEPSLHGPVEEWTLKEAVERGRRIESKLHALAEALGVDFQATRRHGPSTYMAD